MSKYETIIKDIERLNNSKSMDFNQWMMWGITQITLMTALILDNVENMDRQAEISDVQPTKRYVPAGFENVPLR